MAILMLELCKIIKKGLMVILPINPFYAITFDFNVWLCITLKYNFSF